MLTIKDILDEYGIPNVGAEHRHGRPGWVSVDCPRCGTGTGKFHLGISLSTGAATCWRCGRQNTARVLAMITGTAPAAMRERIDGAALAPAVVRKVGRLLPPAAIGPLTPAHRAYLTHRGFVADDVARLWGIRGIGNASKLGWRLYIPIHHHGEVVSWTTRSIKPKAEQRWVSASAEEEVVHHKDILYGADYARHAIIIHEGPTDVWATGPGAVATCGTGFTESQLRAMARYPVRAVCFDNGVAAQRRARELADMLSPFPGVTHNVQLETGDDPAEASVEELDELRAAFLG